MDRAQIKELHSPLDRGIDLSIGFAVLPQKIARDRIELRGRRPHSDSQAAFPNSWLPGDPDIGYWEEHLPFITKSSDKL